MADIELVIKIDERDVELVRKNFKPAGYSFIPTCIQTEFVSAILNSTPLPKGHGRLIDADDINEKLINKCSVYWSLAMNEKTPDFTTNIKVEDVLEMIKEAPTIIGAESEEV